ncbi:MAG: hypothetical protein HY689_08360 [Chloroflexi bacterium]|nr:hypothetical protein [Chloroflexota bacterium]
MTREVHQLPGIQDLAFEFRTKTVTVTFDPQQVAADDIRRAIARANAAMGHASDASKAATDLLTFNP